jgi:hypothetical protein
MSRRRIALVAALGALLTALVVYGVSRANSISPGVDVAGVEVGGLEKAAARELLAERLSARLRRPVRVRAGGRTFTLRARRAGVRADPDAMVEAALRRSREGNPLRWALRELRGLPLEAHLPARVRYNAGAVTAFTRQLKQRVDRRPRDARVRPSGDGLGLVRAREGLDVEAAQLERRVAYALRRLGRGRRITAPMRVTPPRITTAQLRRRHPRFITVDRQSFQLRFYRRLKLVRSYTIAVGQVGFDTPAGLYHVQNKAVNPSWQVPNKGWAGDKAGRLIPPGPENPIKARWMGIYDGAGIHGTDEVGSLGSAASHGCIRMAIPEVTELYRQVPVKTPVYIG